MKILCVFGKHQYGDASRGVGTEYAAFVPTLERLGHQVVHFESWDRSGYRGLADMNQKLLPTLRALLAQPDRLAAMSGASAALAQPNAADRLADALLQLSGAQRPN